MVMDHTTPSGWIDRWAAADFDRPALAFDDGIVSYGQLATEVEARARSLKRDVDVGQVTPVFVGPDLPSIVDLFAHIAVGAVPMPRSTSRPKVDGSEQTAPSCVSQPPVRLVPLDWFP